MIKNLDFLRSGLITRSSPTNKISIYGDFAFAISAPSITDAGALSPPIASSAIFTILDRVNPPNLF